LEDVEEEVKSPSCEPGMAGSSPERDDADDVCPAGGSFAHGFTRP
jgi:hypothetical protein